MPIADAKIHDIWQGLALIFACIYICRNMLHKAVIWQGKKCKQKKLQVVSRSQTKVFFNLVNIILNFKKYLCRIIRLDIISSRNCKGSVNFIRDSSFVSIQCQILLLVEWKDNFFDFIPFYDCTIRTNFIRTCDLSENKYLSTFLMEKTYFSVLILAFGLFNNLKFSEDSGKF